MHLISDEELHCNENEYSIKIKHEVDPVTQET